MARRGLGIVLSTIALEFTLGCSDVAQQPVASGAAAALGGSAGATPSSGAGGVGGYAGAGSGGSAGGGGQSAGSGGGDPIAGAPSAGSGGSGGAPQCAPTCSGTTPVCDLATVTCKTCTAFEGCSSDKPLCDTAANGGLGECKLTEVIAIYTDYLLNMDLAHRSYVYDANEWFPSVAEANGFTYEATPDWERLKTVVPARGRIVAFLDDKPKDLTQQAAFQAYMDGGGAWFGCHFAAYNPAPTDWDWYFNQFLGSGGYNGNTWRPTSAELLVENPAHPLSEGLGSVFTAAPNEWYAWKIDLRTKPNIEILLSIDPSSFPLGTGPKPEEIWHEGYYPIVWTNTDYRMLYINMGHDDMDYGGTNGPLSSTFSSPEQNQMYLNAIRWLGGAIELP